MGHQRRENVAQRSRDCGPLLRRVHDGRQPQERRGGADLRAERDARAYLRQARAEDGHARNRRQRGDLFQRCARSTQLPGRWTRAGLAAVPQQPQLGPAHQRPTQPRQRPGGARHRHRLHGDARLWRQARAQPLAAGGDDRRHGDGHSGGAGALSPRRGDVQRPRAIRQIVRRFPPRPGQRREGSRLRRHRDGLQPRHGTDGVIRIRARLSRGEIPPRQQDHPTLARRTATRAPGRPPEKQSLRAPFTPPPPASAACGAAPGGPRTRRAAPPRLRPAAPADI